MAGRYIPPALRKKNESVEDQLLPKQEKPDSKVSDDDLVSPEEVRNCFWPVDEVSGAFAQNSTNKTLHDSAATPGKLAYLFLFNLANPRWETDHIVYSKSNLELLPTDLPHEPQKESQSATNGVGAAEDRSNRTEPASASPHSPQSIAPDTDGTETTAAKRADTEAVAMGTSSDASPMAPIAVFRQVKSHQGARSFTFEGWFKIERLAFLEPRSPELVRMLEQKWTKTDRHGRAVQRARDSRAWEQSLGYRWAVIEFAKDEVAEVERGAPKIERLPDGADEMGGPTKSVNEMLAEMRLGSQVKAKAEHVGDGASMESSARMKA